MAMPDNELSSQPVPDAMEFGKVGKVTRTSDFEMGGIALNDPSQGHFVQEWHTFINEDGTKIITSSATAGNIVLYEGSNLTEVSCTFDQNMRPVFSFVEGGEAKLEWYDSQIEDRTVTVFGSSMKTPKVSLDDKRDLSSNSSDIILAYVKGDALYHRRQRDRYETEYFLHPFVSNLGELQCIGMLENKRFGFSFLPSNILDEK